MGAEQSTPRAQPSQTSQQPAIAQSSEPLSGISGFLEWARSGSNFVSSDANSPALPPTSPPKVYVPDFLTQHAQHTQSMIKPSTKHWQGKSKMGLDCYSMTQERKFQAHISQTYVSDHQPMQGFSPSMHVETFVQQKMQQNKEAWDECGGAGRGNLPPLAGTSNVPFDDWRIVHARKATELGANAAHGVRNRYQLSGSVASGLRWVRFEGADPSEGTELVNSALAAALENNVELTEGEWKGFRVKNLRIDHFVRGEGVYYFKPAGMMAPKRSPGDWETKFLTETKKIVRGALKRDWVGARPTIKGSIYLDEAKVYKNNLSPPKKSEYQGIKSNVRNDDFVISAYRDANASIAAASRPDRIPAPNMGPDAKLFEHVRSVEKAKCATGSTSRWPFSGGLAGILSTRRAAHPHREPAAHQSQPEPPGGEPTVHESEAVATADADAAEQETPESEPLAGDNEQEMPQPVAHVDDAASGGEQQIVANGGDVPPTAQQIEADGAPVAHGGQDPSATAPFAPSGEELQIGEIEPAGADEEAVTA